jgi:hypothetical protein
VAIASVATVAAAKRVLSLKVIDTSKIGINKLVGLVLTTQAKSNSG